jgi:predicted O-linked N-acetylglucosamine transferase (SPINDLY family)
MQSRTDTKRSAGLKSSADLQKRTEDQPQFEAALAAYIEKSSGVPLQLSSLNLVRHYELRGRILTIAHNVGAQIPEVPIPRDGRRLNIGFIAMDFGPQTETYTLFPWFENLDPERFDVHLLAIKQTNTAVEQYIASKANGIRFLGNDTDLQLSTLRSASLDVLVFGGNLTADLDELTRLALYRIAPLQVANQSSNGTTGLPEIDLCISGALTDPEKSSEQYSERLAILPSRHTHSTTRPMMVTPSATSREKIFKSLMTRSSSYPHLTSIKSLQK